VTQGRKKKTKARAKFHVREVLAELERRAPSGTAESWDNVGLLAGDSEWKTGGAVVSIDLTPAALRRARASKAGLIVLHHPAIFPKNRGLSRVVPGGEGSLSRLLLEAIRSRIAIVACHTNFDRCALEVVEAVSRGLGAVPKGRLIDDPSGVLKKLVVYVPRSHAEPVQSAIFEAGAGQIGDYGSCSFGCEGEGTFRGGAGTNPFIGKPGMLERAAEVRLETVFPAGMERPVLKALVETHPYEEVAYDLYSVEQEPGSRGLVRGLGYGFWGEFPRPKPFSELSKNVRSLFKLDGFWITDSPPTRIRRIAFVAGKGASFIGAARAAGCDALITGETGYHAALDGWRQGLAVMELGHRESELFFVKTMSSWLSQLGLHAVESNAPTQFQET
jgi:dinuclear metal center YbgI/SA1388 family protein